MMPAHPLTARELDRLEELLLDRSDEDACTGQDEGVLNASELDGFLTAIVSGPTTLVPSEWLPALWGDFEPVFQSEDELREFMTSIMRHSNWIASRLMDAPADFEPLFFESKVENQTVTIVDEWCEGYMRGVGLAAKAWSSGGPEVKKLLQPIRSFTEETDWAGHDLPDPKAADALRDSITHNARELHAFWLAKRSAGKVPVRRGTPRVGRNDPCPCGSGSKFKRCCNR